MNHPSAEVSLPVGQASEAIGAMLERIRATLAGPGPGFPHTADPDSGVWQRTPAGDWTGGFWVGELWLAAAITGDAGLRAAAREWSQRVDSRARSDTVFRGFLFWYGAAIGGLLLDDADARERAVRGAQSLAASFNPAIGALPLGAEAEEAHSVGQQESNIDGVPGGTPLLYLAARLTGEAWLADVARRHTATHASACVRPDGSVVQSVSFDPVTGKPVRTYTHKGSADDSTWSRAQAWGMLGFAQAAAWDTSFLPLAEKVADWWVAHVPTGRVAYWDFDVPQQPPEPLDTSATAIAAAAMLKLGALNPARAAHWRAAATATTSALAARHLSLPGSARPAGVLAEGCYNRRLGLATSSELIWGDYFLLEALAVLDGHVDPVRI